jgi:UDP-glucose:(heptosyl)LPS alpha-1,3-glucosyltransferase
MRIALSAPDVNLAGGIERVVTETANWLAGAGHHVTVYAARTERAVLADAVQVHEIHVPANMDVLGLGFRSRADSAIKADGADVHGAFSALSPLGGVFWIPSVHRVGYDLLLTRRSVIGRLPVRLNPYHRVRLRLEREMFSPGGYSRLLALSDGVKSDVMSIYGVPETDVDVLPYGFDPGVFDAARRESARAEARVRFGYEEGDRVLLFVANELERKGFDVLLEALALLDDQSVKLLGAGRVAPHRYRSQIARLGLASRLHWAGSSNDVALLHAASDAFVLPTRYEAWGLVIVEALASGLPVVTTRLAGAAVTVREGETGRLLRDCEDPQELAEALEWVVSGGPVTSGVIAASVRSFSWPEIIARYERVLTSAAEGSGPATV